MGRAIGRITLKGFKSIESLENFRLDKLNVLIGANGAGKSNFVDYFRMLHAIADGAFQQFVNNAGGSDGFFFLGPRSTPTISSKIAFGSIIYEFALKPTTDGKLQIVEERAENDGVFISTLSGDFESQILFDRYEAFDSSQTGLRTVRQNEIYDSVFGQAVYHFHDTSPLSQMRRDQSVRDFSRLRQDASNIASFLLHLRDLRVSSYILIRDTVRLIAPYFDDLLLRPQTKGSNELVRLEWRQKGSDFPFQPYQLSDGTIRFICLATALLQPEPPATIVIDEPELGLHPYAISVLSDLIQSASERTQVIVSTQSPNLLDSFEPEQIIVVNRRDGRSTFERLDSKALAEWLDDYSVGELWQKNVVQGGPARE